MTPVPLVVLVSDLFTVLFAALATALAFRTWRFAHGRLKATWAAVTMGRR